MKDCLVCQEISGEIVVPGELLHAGKLTVVFHVPPLNTDSVHLGYLMVSPRRHVEDFAGVTTEEAASVGVEISRWSKTLKDAGAERVYVAVVGHDVAHLHVHLIPRWPGTPTDIAWHAVDEWAGARRGDFNDASSFASRLREKYEAMVARDTN